MYEGLILVSGIWLYQFLNLVFKAETLSQPQGLPLQPSCSKDAWPVPSRTLITGKQEVINTDPLSIYEDSGGLNSGPLSWSQTLEPLSHLPCPSLSIFKESIFGVENGI